MKKTIYLTILFLLITAISFAQTKDEPIVNISVDTLPFGELSVGASYEFEYTLSAQNLTENLTVSVIPGQGFRVSENGSDWYYAYTISQSGGTITERTLYVKFVPTQEITYSTNISHTTGDYTLDLPVTGIGVGVDDIYIIINPYEINFGNIPIGANSILEFWYDIKNDWPTSTMIYFPSSAGFTNDVGGSWIQSSGSQGDYEVMFTPPSVGFFDGYVEIESTTSGFSGYLYVYGNGVIPAMSLTSQSYDFWEVEINNYSSEFTYTITGTTLVGDITITAPYGFEISLTSGADFTDEIILSATDGSVEDTQIFVRFAPQITTPYAGNIIHETDYGTTQNIVLSGKGVSEGTPIIYVSKTNLEFEDVLSGSISEEQIYTISAINLSDDITVISPEGFEISETSGADFSDEIILDFGSGTVTNTDIFVRFAPETNQLYSGNISHNSADATEHNIAVLGDGLTKINDLSNNDFVIYPNPSNGIFTINNEQLTINNLIITNITGKIIFSKDVACNVSTSKFDLSNQSKGIYFIKINTETGIYTEKLIIQ